VPTFMVTSPEGKKYRVNAPDGATQADAINYIQRKQDAPQQQKQQPSEPLDTSTGRTVFDQAMQGGTFGFSDEISDRIGALIASQMMGKPYNEMLETARTGTKERLDKQLQDRPVLSIASNIAGGLVTGGAGAATKTGTAVGNSLRTGNLAARAAKGAAAGAASGAAYGAGTADEGERLSGAGTGALVGGALGAAAPVASAGLSKLNTALGKYSPIPNADDLRKVASQSYKLAEQKGGILKPEFTNQFVDEIQKLKPQTEIGKIVGGDSPFTKVVEKVSAIRDKPITLEAAQELDELLGEAIDDFTDMGRVTKQGKKLLDVQSTFRSMIEDAGEDLIEGGKEGFAALKEGRKLWATSRKLADIERIINRAELTDNPATSIKSGFRVLLSNPNRLKGFSPEEIKAMRQAAKDGIVPDALRTLFGSRLLPIITGASGGGLGATATASALSMASRGAATKAKLGEAYNVARTVANQGKKPVKTPLLSKRASFNTDGVLTGNISDKLRGKK
jgi:hypothetical protein